MIEKRCYKIKSLLICIAVIVLLPVHSYCEEVPLKEIYGIKREDSLMYVKTQAEKYGFKVIEKPVSSEMGKELGLYCYRNNELVLIIVIFKEKVHWIDVLEKGVNINGVVVGTDLFRYHKKNLKMKLYGHRDCSLDDLVCVIGDRISKVKVLIDYKYSPLVKEYKEKRNPALLKKIFIKGIVL